MMCGSGSEYYQRLLNQEGLDAEFVIEDGGGRVGFHKNVLVLVSNVVALMSNKTWKVENTCYLSRETKIEIVTLFLKVIYLGLEQCWPINVDDISGFLVICDMYLDDCIIGGLCSELEKLIEDSNVWLHLLKTTINLNLYRWKRLQDVAGFQVGRTLEVDPNLSILWDSDIWSHVLDIKESTCAVANELVFYNRLVLWKNFDPDNRHENFQKLARKIRYPLLTLSEIYQFVEPQSILSLEELATVSKYVNVQGDDPGPFIAAPRGLITIESDFHFGLLQQKGLTDNCIYRFGKGIFTVVKNMVCTSCWFIGQGIDDTVLRIVKAQVFPIQFTLQNCLIEHMSIVSKGEGLENSFNLSGDRVRIQNVTFVDCQLFMSNCEMTLVQNVKCEGGKCGIRVGHVGRLAELKKSDTSKGTHVLRNIEVVGVEVGIVVAMEARRTQIENCKFRESQIGILLSSSGSTVSDILFEYSPDHQPRIGYPRFVCPAAIVISGQHNNIRMVKVVHPGLGTLVSVGVWCAKFLNLGLANTGNILTNCRGGSIGILGRGQIVLGANVNTLAVCGERHSLYNVIARRLVHLGIPTYTAAANCQLGYRPM